ncbi:hypothetical protein B7494_g3872 [Chlorociboria aeruginascens]|nr:hypothetical protein B7494_g3872 [Chlorociboria aeruginascens]
MPRHKTPKTPKSPKEPLLTQESFEAELKTLASKAQEETWGKWARGQIFLLLKSGMLLSLAAIYSNVSPLTLSPVYGSYPSAIYHSPAVMATCFLGWSLNLITNRLAPLKPIQLLALLAIHIPMLQFSLFRFSGLLGVKYGPIVTESLTFLPLLFLTVSCTATLMDGLELTGGKWPWISEAAPGILSYAFFRNVEAWSGTWIQQTIGFSFFQTRIGLEIALAALYMLLAPSKISSFFKPSKIMLLAIPAILHTVLYNTHVALPYLTSRLNTTIQNGWTVLARHESITGYISVIESGHDQFRALRCDHSILGVELEVPIKDEEASALVIGLGIGTTPTALMHHGINTTIVEIDPIVHDYATQYFGLPANHNAIIDDAVSYASTAAKTGQTFDYIIHDVFTGGAEPVDLFTLEFIQDLYTMLKPGGVIAINYAGDFLLPPARIIIHTIRTIFPHCRIYRETPASSVETIALEKRDFANMVIFCTKPPPSPSLKPHGITFRKPSRKDVLGTGARNAFLQPEFEIEDEVFEEMEGDGGVLRRNETDRFREWQDGTARGHWAVMRSVIPAVVWEAW